MKRWTWIVLAVAAILRVAFIWRNPLWYDENFTLLLTRLPLIRMLAATAGDVHPPLYYLLLWPLGQIPGLPIWVLRIPSALFSILAVWLFWRVSLVMGIREPLAWVGLAVFAIIPQQIYYAQEARMYSLLTALLLWAWLAVMQRHWLLLFVLSLAMLYTHNYGLFYVASIWLAGMISDRSAWKTLTLVTALAGICWLPWGFVLAGQVAQISGNYWILPSTIGSILWDLAHSFFSSSSTLPANILSAAIFFGWLTFALAYDVRYWIKVIHLPTVILPIMILAFGPWLMAAAVSVLVQPVMLFRALVPCGGFMVLLMARPILYVVLPGKRIQTWVALLLLLPALLVNLASYYLFPEYNKASAAEIVGMERYIQTHGQVGDIVYHTSDYSWVTTAPYAGTLLQYRMPPCANSLGGLSMATRSALGEREISLEHLDYGRAWLMVLETPYTPLCEQDYLQPILSSADLISCQRDDPLVRECLYLVKR
jgi:uncharacterized membrane protein